MFDFGEEIMIAEQGFLPLGRADMEARGWDMVDFLYFIWGAYFDNPSI